MKYSSVTLSPKEEAVLELIKDLIYENYFFNKVSDVKWFETLKEKGYFDPEKAPGPQSADEKGYVTIPLWNVLTYLENVSNQVNESGNEKYIDELLGIIRNVTQYHIDNNKCLDNYHTWTYFVRILANIPNDRIPVPVLDLIPIWLESNYAGSALGDDLALKLLPKFLSDKPVEDDTLKAETIFEHMIGIKWPEEAREKAETIIGDKKEPYLVLDHHWLTESLINRKYILRIGERCSDELIFSMGNKLKEIFRIQMNPNGFDVTIDNDKYRIIVNHADDFEFKCFGGKVDEEKRMQYEGAEKLYRKLSYFPDAEFQFEIKECKNPDDFAAQIVSELNKLNRGNVESGLNDRMILFYRNIFNDFSYIWYKDLAEMPRWIGQSNAKELLVLFLRELIIAKIKTNTEFGKMIVDKFLGEDYQYPLFRRFVLHIISEFWGSYRDIFRNLLQSDSAVEWFDNINYEVELYLLLERNIKSFNSDIKERLKDIIKNGPQRDYVVEDKEKYANYWRQKWCSALKSDNEFSELYESYCNKTGVKEHIPAHEPAVQTRSGPGKSPMTVEQVFSTPNSELATFLGDFETRDWWEGPTEDALADSLKQAIKGQPAKFLDDLDAFVDAPYLYVVYLLWGLRDAWNSKTLFDWGKLFIFLEQYITRNEFWRDKLPIKGDHWKPNHHEVMRTLGSLIQDGIKEDEWAFSEIHNHATSRLFAVILTDEHIADMKKARSDGEMDYIVDMHNTPVGEIIIALIYLSLRIARLQGAENDAVARWGEDLKTLYERVLAADIVEAYTAFGQYLPNFMYLDKDWTENKIKELEEPRREVFRKAFMAGYLNIMQVYDNIYALMHNHYRWAMETTLRGHTSEQLVSHITISYLRGNSGLFEKLLDKWKFSHIRDIINFFSRESKFLLKPDAENRDITIGRVIDFRKRIYEKYTGENCIQSEDDKKILSIVTRLTVYFNTINETEFNWLMLSAPYVHIEGNERWLLESLDELKDKGDKKESIKYILQVILEMFNYYVVPFAQEYIKSIVVYAYEQNVELQDTEIKQMASDICNILGAAGFHYLREIYERYNKN